MKCELNCVFVGEVKSSRKKSRASCLTVRGSVKITTDQSTVQFGRNRDDQTVVSNRRYSGVNYW